MATQPDSIHPTLISDFFAAPRPNEYIVPHLEDLIYMYMFGVGRPSGMTFKVYDIGSNYFYFTSYRC